jgi:hypothetical protein
LQRTFFQWLTSGVASQAATARRLCHTDAGAGHIDADRRDHRRASTSRLGHLDDAQSPRSLRRFQTSLETLSFCAAEIFLGKK